jgi:Na+/H+ antiporter NhaD/arsenite permease-like protein
MKHLKWHWFLVVLVFMVFCLPGGARAAQGGNPSVSTSRLFISGHILDPHRDPVKDAEIHVWVNGKLQRIKDLGALAGGVRSQSDGEYLVDLEFSHPLPPGSTIALGIHKSSFRLIQKTFTLDQFAQRDGEYFLPQDFSLKRVLGPAFWIATLVLLGVYAMITFEILHRTIVAMLGAAIILALSATLGSIDPEFHIISFQNAMQKIDLNVILLLLGMMVIVGVLKESGIFQWAAARCFSLARGNIFVLALILMTFTALTSAFLDNVTTMLLVAPVTIEIALALGISPLALLIPETLASNVGGTATLIGDPPNIMIGSYAGLSFLSFIQNLALVCIIVMVPLFIISKYFYGKEYHEGRVEDPAGFARALREEHRITDRKLLTVGLAVLALVIGLFLTHSIWHMEVSVAAIFGASLFFAYALLTGRVRIQEFMEKEIDWATLLFFLFLFIIIGAVEETGLLSLIADWILELSRGHMTAAICMILWGSAIMSAFIDNIPFTATMLPITAYLTQVIPGSQSGVLWWALALGACLGGNGTMIGASANVVTVGIAESRGHEISFLKFMKIGFLYMVISVAIANIWLLVAY